MLLNSIAFASKLATIRWSFSASVLKTFLSNLESNVILIPFLSALCLNSLISCSNNSLISAFAISGLSLPDSNSAATKILCICSERFHVPPELRFQSFYRGVHLQGPATSFQFSTVLSWWFSLLYQWRSRNANWKNEETLCCHWKIPKKWKASQSFGHFYRCRNSKYGRWYCKFTKSFSRCFVQNCEHYVFLWENCKIPWVLRRLSIAK